MAVRRKWSPEYLKNHSAGANVTEKRVMKHSLYPPAATHSGPPSVVCVAVLFTDVQCVDRAQELTTVLPGDEKLCYATDRGDYSRPRP
ncbi:hypothetical protein HF086_014967 [Spodoptera exigua]|uniref:Uncharacterized protein n=1 Tax=Spodoptera exigua TaxID=7107 RepID=A0A922MKE4_SPOEX|nr:hypothetical protein HF086_014967 [Spodoptera exigua]